MANVFQRTGATAARAPVTDPSQLIDPAALQGRTAHFAVYLLSSVLESRFPKGRPSGLTSDNPFPL